MHANIDEPLSVDEVATAAGISRRQLERLFKRHVGQVPTRYYQQMRLRRARQLLLQSGMSIMAIAQACGFRSPPHFSKAYRAHFGHTPSAERRPSIAGPAAAVQPQWLTEPDPLLVSEDLATALATPDVPESTLAEQSTGSPDPLENVSAPKTI
jgi:AraC-like DNA-binding protein